jgi:hypothetical protein
VRFDDFTARTVKTALFLKSETVHSGRKYSPAFISPEVETAVSFECDSYQSFYYLNYSAICHPILLQFNLQAGSKSYPYILSLSFIEKRNLCYPLKSFYFIIFFV